MRRPLTSVTKSKQPSILEADAGAYATHVHHKITTFLAIATPLLFLSPDSVTDGMFGKAFELLLSGNIAVHSWVGLNYVARDYVPKVSYALLPPARVLCAAVGAITFLGMGRVALSSPGGIKGCMKGLWKGKAGERTK